MFYCRKSLYIELWSAFVKPRWLNYKQYKSTAVCCCLSCSGSIISILSDVIQLASRLVAMTFRTVWTFNVKYTYSTLVHAVISLATHWLTFPWESLRCPYLSFSGKHTSSCWHFLSKLQWQCVPEQRAYYVPQISTFWLMLQFD